MKPCPKCQSINCKKASLIYAEGTSATVGAGISMSGNIGVGVASTKSSLAAKCAPPQMIKGFPPDTLFNISIAAAVIIIASNLLAPIVQPSSPAPFIFILTLLYLPYLNSQNKKWVKIKKAEHLLAIEAYDKKFICMVCGEDYEAL